MAHLQRPSFGDTSTWKRHIQWARSECTKRRNIVAVGDFNTTLANLGGSRIGHCEDTAASLGQTAAGTWPTDLPAGLGASIDHVFTGPDWTPIAFGVLTGGTAWGSDHRPIVTVIDRQRQGEQRSTPDRALGARDGFVAP